MKKLFLGAAVLALSPGAAHAQAPAPVPAMSQAELIESFRLIEVSSVADAIEQLYGTTNYMSHEIQPLNPAKFVGPAVTVMLKREEHKEGAKAQQGMIDAIDAAPAGSVYVMVVEDGANFAGIGGLMSTTMKVRGFAGAVVDGGVRDTPQITRIQFPVFSRAPVPSTTVNHYRFAGSNIPVVAGGVRVAAGDLISADLDGVVVIPRDKAAAILAKARELEWTEHGMYPFIAKERSLKKAVDAFGRL